MMKAVITAFAFSILMVITAVAQVKPAPSVDQRSSLPRGDKASPNYFTGDVWVYPVSTDTLAHWSIGKVTFAPGSHSNWHFHPGKQVLVIIEGTGYLKEKNKPIQILKKGDVATIQPGVEHWHGATPDKGFVQVVINPNIEKGVVNWLQAVTPEEYNDLSLTQNMKQKVRLAKLIIDANQLDSYNAALKEGMETAMRVEPGVLTLYAVAEKDNPTHITIVEIYADEEAYKQHIQTPHFLKYKTVTRDMVKSLELVDVIPLLPKGQIRQ